MIASGYAEMTSLMQQLGEALPRWSQLLVEIRRTRSTFDTAEVQHDFGVCVISYAGVQGKVAAKYDAWQRDILSRYGLKLASSMRELYGQLMVARQELERQTINATSTAQAVSFITFVQDLKRKAAKWTSDIAALVDGQRTLERQRYGFPDGWLHVDQVQGEWGAFQEILKRKDAAIQDQIGMRSVCPIIDNIMTDSQSVAGLRLKVTAEQMVVQDRITETETQWSLHKQVDRADQIPYVH